MAEKFMSYEEYQQKQAENTKKIAQLKEDYDFSWDNMGSVNNSAEAEGKKISKEMMELRSKAEHWSKKHPNWVNEQHNKRKMRNVS